MNKKTLFIVIIVVFVLSTIASFAAYFGGSGREKGQIGRDIDRHKEALEQDVIPGSDSTYDYGDEIYKGTGFEGVVRKLDTSIYAEGTHYLEADGLVLVLLESSSGVDLDKYIGKNIKVWGEDRLTGGGDGYIIDVEKVEISNN